MGTISGAEISVMRKDQAWGCLRDRDPGRWLSQCKGPEAAAHLCISRKSKEAGVAAGPGHSGNEVGRKMGEGEYQAGPGVQTEDGGHQPRFKLLLRCSFAEGPWVRDGASHASVSLSAAGPPSVTAVGIK